jgi:hypothetical protein
MLFVKVTPERYGHPLKAPAPILVMVVGTLLSLKSKDAPVDGVEFPLPAGYAIIVSLGL